MIYFPATANILTPGHIKCLEHLSERGPVIVGLLTAKALSGYKKERVPFEDREYVMETVASTFHNVTVVPQNSLDPSTNIRKFRCDAMASGDGFEPSEKRAAKRLGIDLVDIKLEGEVTKRYASSKIK